MHRCIFCIGLLWIVQGCLSYPNEDIWNHIKSTSDPNLIPLPQGRALEVSLSFKILNILAVNEINNEVDVLFLQETSWKDTALAWNQSQTQSGSVTVPVNALWLPDLAAYNAISKPDVISPELAKILFDGSIFYVPNIRQQFSCNVSGFDAEDGATCRIKIGSWTYHNQEISLVSRTDELSQDDDYGQFSSFEILDVTQKKNTESYTCCPDQQYDDIEITFRFRTKRSSKAS